MEWGVERKGTGEGTGWMEDGNEEQLKGRNGDRINRGNWRR